MKRNLALAGFLAVLVALSGCGTDTVQPTTDLGVSISSEADTQTDDADNESQTGKEEEKTMSGELLKDTEDLSKNQEENTVDTVGMTEVSETICPSSLALKDPKVKYGTVTHFTYASKTTGCDRGANILLPADYDETKEYPVLFFLHGIFGDEYSMINDGNNKINEIVTNLKVQGRIDDVVVVFPNMYASSNPDLQPGFTVEQTLPYDNFINDLVNDLIPYVEANYSVKKDSDNRALIGFSMGGRESLFIGITKPDSFSCVGCIAPAPGVTPGKDWAMEHPGQMAEDELYVKDTDNKHKLLMVCCGTKDSVVGQFPLSYHNIMVNNNQEHLWYEVPGADHDSNAIKSGLYNFLIRWFN